MLDRLKELLSYDPETGEFRWAVNLHGCGGAVRVGKLAGAIDTNGHRQIKLDGRLYFAHRLAWLWCHGEWPEGFLDHENNLYDDNRIANLRAATHAQNMSNKRRYKNNTSGFKGVCAADGKWVASIQCSSKRVLLGRFENKEEAARAYDRAARQLFGEFARTNF